MHNRWCSSAVAPCTFFFRATFSQCQTFSVTDPAEATQVISRIIPISRTITAGRLIVRLCATHYTANTIRGCFRAKRGKTPIGKAADQQTATKTLANCLLIVKWSAEDRICRLFSLSFYCYLVYGHNPTTAAKAFSPVLCLRAVWAARMFFFLIQK